MRAHRPPSCQVVAARTAHIIAVVPFPQLRRLATRASATGGLQYLTSAWTDAVALRAFIFWWLGSSPASFPTASAHNVTMWRWPDCRWSWGCRGGQYNNPRGWQPPPRAAHRRPVVSSRTSTNLRPRRLAKGARRSRTAGREIFRQPATRGRFGINLRLRIASGQNICHSTPLDVSKCHSRRRHAAPRRLAPYGLGMGPRPRLLPPIGAAVQLEAPALHI